MASTKPAVLIVDDEKVICEGLSRVLSEDYETFYALNGKEALDIVRRQGKIDVMLCDIKMPEMEGTEVIRTIRSSNKNMVVIVMTAVTNPKKVCEAMRYGANNFMLKPLDIPLLTSTIRSAVRKRT